MIAIHIDKDQDNFAPEWVRYCQENGLSYKEVSCYDSDILEQLQDCEALLWHIQNFNYKDHIFAKYLIKSLENKPIEVFPDNNSLWHYDDKIAQKYLLEAIGAPVAETHVFYSLKAANAWISEASFPKVFKLRKGSGSRNVALIRSKSQALKLAKKAFGKGFPTLDMYTLFKERIRKYSIGKETLFGVFKGFVRLFIGAPFKNRMPREKGYFYVQEFYPGNTFDQRIIVIGDRAIGLKREVRKNDFRASGSGLFSYERDSFDEKCIRIAFEINQKLGFSSMAYDFIYDATGNPVIVEISYCFNKVAYYGCPGYWDKELRWHPGKVSPVEWMLEDLLKLKNHSKAV